MVPDQITVNAIVYGKRLIDGRPALRSVVDRYMAPDGRERVCWHGYRIYRGRLQATGEQGDCLLTGFLAWALKPWVSPEALLAEGRTAFALTELEDAPTDLCDTTAIDDLRSDPVAVICHPPYTGRFVESSLRRYDGSELVQWWGAANGYWYPFGAVMRLIRAPGAGEVAA